MRRAIIVLAILLMASCSWAADYKMIVASPKELRADGVAYEPNIFHDVYPLQHGSQDITEWQGLHTPNAQLVEIVVDNATAWQIIADGSYLVLQSTIIQPSGPGQEPVTPQPELTLLPTEVLDSTKLGEIAAALAGYSMVYDADGNPGAIPPCPEGSSPLKCNQLSQGYTTTSAARIQSDMAGKTRAEVVETFKSQMKAFPKQVQ